MADFNLISRIRKRQLSDGPAGSKVIFSLWVWKDFGSRAVLLKLSCCARFRKGLYAPKDSARLSTIKIAWLIEDKWDKLNRFEYYFESHTKLCSGRTNSPVLQVMHFWQTDVSVPDCQAKEALREHRSKWPGGFNKHFPFFCGTLFMHQPHVTSQVLH